MSQLDDDANNWNPDDESEPALNMGTCRYCGGAVEWIHSGVRWRMYAPGEAVHLHQCANTASADEFGDVA